MNKAIFILVASFFALGNASEEKQEQCNEEQIDFVINYVLNVGSNDEIVTELINSNNVTQCVVEKGRFITMDLKYGDEDSEVCEIKLHNPDETSYDLIDDQENRGKTSCFKIITERFKGLKKGYNGIQLL